MRSRGSIDHVMTPSPTTLPSGATLSEAALAMQRNDIGSVVVIHDNGTVRGLLTDRDIVVRGLAVGLDPNRATVGDVCSRDLVVLDRNDSVSDAIGLMTKCAVRRLPVVEHGVAVGIVSLGDLAMSQDPKSALGTISGAPANV